MQEFEASARKLASCHPLLMLRNLPLVAASLKGRTEYEFSFFRSRNHMTLYNISLGVLELLKPYVFRPEYADALDSALKCYFDMVYSYFNRRDSIYGLIDRFVTFLHHYMDERPSRAVSLILREGQMLPDLSRAMPNISSLKQLVSGINFGSSSSASTGSVSACHIANSRKEAARDASHFRSTLSACAAGGDEEIAGALVELNGIAVSRPHVLGHVVDEINALIAHPSKGVRVQAYNLLLKYLRHSPKNCGDVIEAYIGCLESSDPSVAVSALEKLPDCLPLALEHIGPVTHAVFCLGLYSGVNVSQYLTEAVGLLNVQAGY